jgi:hypothetical protein
MSADPDAGRRLPVPLEKDDGTSRVVDALLSVVARVPASERGSETDPRRAALGIARQAASRAAVTASSLAMPPGPLGWLTIGPELVAVWRIQAQMVADVAAVYGKTATLNREHMLFCLFRHTAAQAMRDICVRVGERWLVRRVSLQALHRVAYAVGVRTTQRSIGRGISRWLPVAGAVGVGIYAFYDTDRVAAAAIDLFERDVCFDTDA